MSEIFVDTIRKTGGTLGTDIRIKNTSVYESDGGTSVTQNMVQSLIKAWLNTNQASINDSLNFASVTDNGTGNYTSTFTNAMNNSSYSVSISSNMGSGNGGYNGTGTSLSTASVNNYSYTNTGSFRDVNPLYYSIAGDLA